MVTFPQTFAILNYMNTTENTIDEPTGTTKFAQLCEELIANGDYNYLAAEISRTRCTGWVAVIRSHHDRFKAACVKLAEGSGESMEVACSNCVDNYFAKIKVENARKQLLDNTELLLSIGISKDTLADVFRENEI